MAQEIKNAFAEIVNRLTAGADATGTGGYGILEGVQLIEGPVEDIYAYKDLPVVIYELKGDDEAEDSHFPDRCRSKFTVIFTVMTNASEGYYSDNALGIIDIYEKIMTVIDQNTAGAVDLTGADNWGPIAPKYKVGSFSGDGMRYTYFMEAEFQTQRYGRGTLRS